MVKKRQAPAIEDVAFAENRPLAMEILTLQSLLARERNHNLSRPQRPAFHHLMLVTHGEGTHTVDFVRHRLRTGMAMHMAPGQVQQFSREPRLDAWLVVFKPDFVRRTPSSKGVPINPDASRLATLTALFKSAEREFKTFDGSKRSESLLRALVEAMCLAIDVGPPLPEGAALVRQFQAALEQSFRKAHEVEAYAAILKRSTRTLTRHCERWTGNSAKRAMNERVALEAQRLLAHEDRTVAEIAENLGYGEATQFVKFFRRLTGETPARFRARHRAVAS